MFHFHLYAWTIIFYLTLPIAGASCVPAPLSIYTYTFAIGAPGLLDPCDDSRVLMPQTPCDNKNRDFLWALDLKNAIISHQSKQLLAPGAILTHGDTEAECVHAITTPPTSIPVTVPASGCDLSHHPLYPHTPIRHWCWCMLTVCQPYTLSRSHLLCVH